MISQTPRELRPRETNASINTFRQAMEEARWPPLACADRLAEQSARVFMLLLDGEWIVRTLSWLGIQ